MKIPNKLELQNIASHSSSDIDFKDFMNLYKTCTVKPYSFLVIHATLASDNPLRFRKNLVERIQKLIMTIDVKIRYESLPYDINREAAKISALSSGKIEKYEYLTGEEILRSNQREIIEQAKFAYSPLGKAFEKQTEKQVSAIKSLNPSNKLKRIEGIFPQNLMNDLIRNKLKEIFELQNIIKKII